MERLKTQERRTVYKQVIYKYLHLTCYPFINDDVIRVWVLSEKFRNDFLFDTGPFSSILQTLVSISYLDLTNSYQIYNKDTLS